MSGYPQSLIYFMWSWQVYFKITSQSAAERLFNKLDPGLDPIVFFIGFLVKKKTNAHQICFEPEDLQYSPDEFKSIAGIAKEIYDRSPERNMFYSGPGMQEEMDGRHKTGAYRLAVEKILNESPNCSDKINFAAEGVMINEYLIYVVLALNKSVYNANLYLNNVDGEDRLKKYYSLIEAAKDVFLRERVINLHLPDPGKNLGLYSRETDELLKEAAKKFTYTVAWAGKDPEGIHILYDACHQISISRYEGKENSGHLIVAARNHPDIDLTLEIERPFKLSDTRKVRKMLELSNDRTAVICNSAHVLGLGSIRSSYDPSTESIFSISFQGPLCWEVKHNNQVLYRMRYGIPELSHEIIIKHKFYSDAQRIFPGVTDLQLENLLTLATELIKQNRGAMLVVVNDAINEVKRLEKQCINIKPIKLTADLLLSLTSIDGAVIIDLEGVAHAKAVILDGLVGLNGDSARGSRYNSAVTYQEYRGLDKPTLIIVVSEDGMVDVMPSLLPQIKHSEITQIIGILQKLNNRDSFDRKAFYNAMEWLGNRRFYLNQMECSQINDLKNKLQKLDKEAGYEMWRVFGDFSVDPQMNQTYYFTENVNNL